MAEMEKSIEVDAPLREVYNQWTQFEEFPQFMEGVVEVRQIDDKRLFWRANVAGAEREWHAEITDQTPDTRIAWKSLTGAENGGAVLFDAVPGRQDEGHAAHAVQPRGRHRERRRRARLRRASGAGRSRALPRPHRGARPRVRRLARRDPRQPGPALTDGGPALSPPDGGLGADQLGLFDRRPRLRLLGLRAGGSGRRARA